MTGTLTYAEPAQLSATARAVVVIVAGTATATSNTIIGTQVIDKPGQQPIAFSVSYKSADINPNLIYTVQAGVEDGQRIWTTSSGVKVITKGNPTTGVSVPLAYRPDLAKGAVTGSITGVGITLAAGCVLDGCPDPGRYGRDDRRRCQPGPNSAADPLHDRFRSVGDRSQRRLRRARGDRFGRYDVR